MSEQLGASVRIFLFLIVLTGGAYPLLMTGIAQIAFPKQANGSLVQVGDKIVGSELIGQKFENPSHFWGRPSEVSNLGPTSRDLKAKIEERKKQGLTDDLLYASASGVDPQISPRSARAQMPRIVASLEMDPSQRDALAHKLKALIEANTEPRQYGILGEPRVNVLKLNQGLDEMRK